MLHCWFSEGNKHTPTMIVLDIEIMFITIGICTLVVFIATGIAWLRKSKRK